MGRTLLAWLPFENRTHRGGSTVKKWVECSSFGPARTAVVVLALTMLGPAAVESQILIICGIYRDSQVDTEANLCQGPGPGCAECVFIPYATLDDGEPVDRSSQSVTADSYRPRLFDGSGELGRPLSLAQQTGLPFAHLKRSFCDRSSLFDRLREAGKERVAPAARDRSRRRASAQVTAR